MLYNRKVIFIGRQLSKNFLSQMAATSKHSDQDIKCVMRLVYDHAVRSVDPATLIQKELKVENYKLITRTKSYNLNNNCYVIGFGKAVLGLASQTELLLGDHLQKGILSIPVGQKELFRNIKFKENSVIQIFEGANNNYPDENSENSTKQIQHLVTSLKSDDVLIVLISGGGSALLFSPIPPVTLQDKLYVIKLLQHAGADIKELNCVRKRLSVLKGGGLLSLAYPAEVTSFILSDVVGDELEYIASGPTVQNNDSLYAATKVLEKYSVLDKMPKSVSEVLNGPSKPAPKSIANNLLIGSNEIALKSALVELVKRGYCAVVLSSSVEGLVSDVFKLYIDLLVSVCSALNKAITESAFQSDIMKLKELLRVSDCSISELSKYAFETRTKICLLFGGEPTVKITGNGKGGRNQQLVLQFSHELGKTYLKYPWMKDFNIGFLSCGTDGMDGPTDAAGAVGYTGQMKNAHDQNLDPDTYIQNNDSYSFFSKLNCGEDLIKIGHTGTNVMDIHIILIEKK